MKKLFLVLNSAFCILNCAAQTNVSGFISINSTWTLAGSPYIIVGNALVSTGFTLTIEPGVIVKFDIDKALQIDGKLIAIGTPENRITFTSNQTNPAPGDWAKIHFPDASVDAVFNSSGNYMSGSIMKYCDVLYGGGLGFGEIHVDMASPYFNNCRIAYSSNAGVYFNSSYSWVDSSSIHNCTTAGLHLQYYELIQKNIFIRNDSIENNSGGIYIGQSGGLAPFSFNILNCCFQNNLSLGAISTSGYTHRNIKIDENIFIMNAGDVVSGDGMENVSISCNRFINNTGRVIYLYNYPSSGTISHNIIDGNNSAGGNVIEFTDYGAPGPMLFTHNAVKNNTSTSSCLRIRPEFDNNLTTQILHNEFINNTTLYTISFNPYSPPSGNFSFLDFRFNTLINSSTLYEFYNNIPYGSSNVNIGSNYWGTTDTQHIDSVIYDYFDFANQSVVYYTPVLVSPAEVDTSCAALPTGFASLKIPNSYVIVFPNPAHSLVTIEWGSMIDVGQIEIINATGTRLYEENIFYASKKQIDVSRFPSGIYFVRLFDEVTNYCKKIIIE